jgi:hypothetical protein
MKNYINWSSSYRHDSHIVTPYGYVEKPPSSPYGGSRYFPMPTSSAAINYAAGKTKQVAWFASNCKDKNGRKTYAYELSRCRLSLVTFTFFLESLEITLKSTVKCFSSREASAIMPAIYLRIPFHWTITFFIQQDYVPFWPHSRHIVKDVLDRNTEL